MMKGIISVIKSREVLPMKTLSLCGLVMLLCLTVSGCAPKGPESLPAGMKPTPLTSESGSQEAGGQPDGQKLFEQNCASCHGIGGDVNPGSGHDINFTSTAFHKMITDGQMKDTIKYGKGMMPAFEGSLSDADVNALVVYVRSLKH